MAQNVLRQNRVAIYRLKRNYGLPIRVWRPIADGRTINLQTGTQVRTWADVEIRRAIRLPHRMKRNFIYDLSYVAANKNFTYGGFFDTDAVLFIVDCKDLGDFVIDQNSHIESRGERFSIIMKTLVEEIAAYIIQTNAVTGVLPVTTSTPSPS